MKMRNRKEFSAKTKEVAAVRANGKCEECGRRLLYGEHKFEFDHIIPLGLGGLSDDGNIRVVCKSCHLDKTTKVDVPAIAKAKRNFRRAAGIKKNSRPIPGSRNSPWQKKFDGRIIKR